MIAVRITDNALNDLNAIYDIDVDAAAEIETALDELQNDTQLAQFLAVRFFKSDKLPIFEVDRFIELWKTGKNLYRLKFWDYQMSLIPYRVLYAHNPRTDCFYVLAVLDRKIAYDTEHPIVKRVVDDYERLGIPTY